jgi:hypothetical protein
VYRYPGTLLYHTHLPRRNFSNLCRFYIIFFPAAIHVLKWNLWSVFSVVVFYLICPPTRSLGINRSSLPCFKKMFPAVCCGLMPTPSLVIIALVFGLTLNSSAQYLRTAVNGAASGTCATFHAQNRELALFKKK